MVGELEKTASRHLVQPDSDCFHFASETGMLEPLASLGSEVKTGDELARIWPINHTGKQPYVVRANRDGLIIARHFPGLVQDGDCLAVLAVDA